MKRSVRGVALLAIGLAAVIGMMGCALIDGILHPGTQGGAGIPWATGESIPVASQSIDTAGGVLTVTDPGGPLDGMTIDVPAGAMPAPTRFDVDYTPISGPIAPNVDPLTPLITVDNGGAFADDVMTVTIPVTIPAGYFAMGFFVDENGKLEGMPLVAETPTSITVATAHFSSFFIAMIADSLLTGTIDTGFRPMTDDWQFANRGSYIAPRGHCAGQSLTAMWYYIERAQQGASTLWNRFDNNGDAPATPDFWQDDSLGYRLASVVQKDIDWTNWVRTAFKALGAADDPLNWNAFLYAMLVTGEPQYVAIYNNTVGGGHAMIVYKADADSGTLYIADPNYPGNSSRKIQYAGGAFSPYNSGANRAEIDAGRGKAYEEIRYFAKTALVDWSQIAARWDEFDLATIGDGVFPLYALALFDDSGGVVRLTDGMAISGDKLDVEAVSLDPALSLGWFVYRDGERLTLTDGKIDLLEGDNRLGFYVLGEVDGKWKYIDFQWVTVRRAGAGFVTFGVTAHTWITFNSANGLDPVTGAIGYSDQYDDAFATVGFKAYASRAFTGNTFTAHWDGFLDGECGPYTGSMTVTFNDDMSEVISFYASDSQVIGGIDGYDHTWSASGSNVPRSRIGNGFYQYRIDFAECCDHLSTYTDTWLFNNGDSRLVTYFTCDVYSLIDIMWFEDVPIWYAPY